MSRRSPSSTAVTTDELVQRLVNTQRPKVHANSVGDLPESTVGSTQERERRLLTQALQNDARVKHSRLAFERLLEVIHDSEGLEVADDAFWQRLETLESALFD